MQDNSNLNQDFLIALVGRSNVGKSALYNRLLNKNQSIVEDVLGTTRDLIEEEIEINNRTVKIIDTGGWLDIDGDVFQNSIRESLFDVFQHASLILFVVDASMSPTQLDYELVDVLRKNYDHSKIILVGNKFDKKESMYTFSEYSKFGFNEEVGVSAYHSLKIHELIDLIANKMPHDRDNISIETDESVINLSIVGRPNVGKSSLVNSILGFERVIVSEHAGTTRDAIDTEFIFEDQKFNLIDTAGIRRRGKIEKGIEKKSAIQAHAAISRGDIAVLLLDLNDPYVAQDSHVASYALDSYKGLILAISKCDIEDDGLELQRVTRIIKNKYRFVSWAPIIETSALHNIGREDLLSTAIKITEQRAIRIDTSELNNFIIESVNKNPPGLLHNRRLKIYYVTQAETSPPHFIFFVNNSANIHFSYKRYLENELRSKYGFFGTSIAMTFKDKDMVEELEAKKIEINN
ncbi:MAG: ribosome biogenesis GTPase Der [Dehalococcoidia bacterium]|nr:ribosome biogenesis GTPase Der [Dehalococcoidia bacterium]